MKIAVFHNLPSGGAKRALYGFVKYLASVGCYVDIFCTTAADETFMPLKQFSKNTIVIPIRRTIWGFIKSTIVYIPPVRSSLADLEAAQQQLAAIINHGAYDVVFVEQDRYTMSPFILKYLDKPHVYYCQQPRRSNEAISKLLYKTYTNIWRGIWHKCTLPRLEHIDRTNASFAKTVLTNSYFSRERILAVYGINSFVSYLGVDIDLFRPLNSKRGSYVLSIGAVIPAKGYDFIIKSLGTIRENVRPRLVVVGNASYEPYRSYIQTLAEQHCVDLEIKTMIDDQELIHLYNRASLYVYAPYLEPFGLAPLEAMACGTPVVAVKEGGVRESVVHGENGLLTERDEREFAEAITELLLDENMRERIGRRAVEIINEFWTIQHAGHRLLHHMERAING